MAPGVLLQENNTSNATPVPPKNGGVEGKAADLSLYKIGMSSTENKNDYESTKVGGVNEILSKQVGAAGSFGDWRDEFFSKGYSVIKAALPRERALQYRQKALDWFEKFDLGMKYDDKSTWTEDKLPIMLNGGMVLNYCAAHEKWMWDARCEDGVIAPFSQLWGTDELLVSFDAVNVTLPGRTDLKWSPWPHVDQSPTRKGLACAQGIINLGEAGPKDGGLNVLEGSSDLFDQFFIENPPKPKEDGAPAQFDWFGFSEENIKWYTDRGCKWTKVEAEPGDVIIWDSRTIHYASLPETEMIRTIIYATYTPAALATKEDLATKAEIFHRFEGTTHWPHCNIFGLGKATRNGERCPAERNEPLEKPEHSDRLLKLAGIKAY